MSDPEANDWFVRRNYLEKRIRELKARKREKAALWRNLDFIDSFDTFEEKRNSARIFIHEIRKIEANRLNLEMFVGLGSTLALLLPTWAGLAFPNSIFGTFVQAVTLENLVSLLPPNALTFTIFGCLMAIFLFSLRGYRPLLYGILEVNVGISFLARASMEVIIADVPSVLQYLAGVYVVIRGLDNVAKALAFDTRVGKIFSRLFNSPKKKAPEGA